MNSRINSAIDGVQGDWSQHSSALSKAWASGDINDYVEAGEIGSSYVLGGLGAGKTVLNSV